MLLRLKKLIIYGLGVLFLIPAESAFAQKNGFTVVIDPGHGGRDPGAIGSSSKEKDIVLVVGKKLGELIKNNHPDVKVLYTRDTDRFVELNKRAEIANKAKADLYISLHCNALDRRKRSPQGVETFVLGLHRSRDNLDVAKAENSVILYEDDYSTKYQGFDPNEPESYIMFEFMTDQYLQQSVYFASLVQNRLVNNSKRTNRDVRQAGFLVLREVAMPSILVELGYISNPSDEKYMKTESGQRSLANSVYLAFKEYKHEYDKKSHVFTNPEQRKTIAANPPSTGMDVTGTSEYRIQFLTAPRKLADNSSQLKGLNPVDFYLDGKTYKYTYGRSSDLNEANKTLKTVQRKFKDAFIVEFRDGKRVK
ncbi:MAG TPA: N-acetylmuramoyl-L-alanine amidase [Porphyromonadaceae bacterium]|jgi:N-acetylmuramoyl-L-alanine amidase|nr:N-acetylmuramoyl-L-alanine amidase [Porphyromonadaceae bacterium]